MKNSIFKKQKIKVIVSLFLISIIVLGISFAVVLKSLSGTKKYTLISNDLKLSLDESKNLTDIIEQTGSIPVQDYQGKRLEGYNFSLINEGNTAVDYVIYLEEDENNTMPIYALRYNLKMDELHLDETGNISDLPVDKDRILYKNVIQAQTTHNYTLKIWLGIQAENDAKNKTYSAHIRVDVSQNLSTYTDISLNGCDPILTNSLTPVIIENNGTVKKASLEEEWYNYSEQRWANAVVLEDDTVTYNVGDTIPEANIESYFVWIPRYKYKIFDEGNYNGVEANVENAVQTIEVEFETKETENSNGSKVGEWLSHPAFQAFDSNGFWVGKFETGYKGATNMAGAQINSSDSAKLQIKPNVYSWRSITVGNAFKVSYDYLRSDESHMMKNTEWGAVALLQHSKYGSRASVRLNNNNSYMTGYAAVREPTCGYNSGTSIDCNLAGTTSSVTLPYNTPTGYTASTTGNITGIYDMSGGAWEYVMGYNVNAATVGGGSSLTTIYSDFFTSNEWTPYYDQYSNSTSSDTTYNIGILGDATKEIGPFANVIDPDKNPRHQSSWYGDFGYTIYSTNPWFLRGGGWHSGALAGVFGFTSNPGGVDSGRSFRVVLIP